MKNFKQLSVGDEILFIDVKKSFDIYKDEYGYVRNDGEIRGVIPIVNIAFEDGNIFINPSYDYGKIKSSSIRIPVDRFNNSNVIRIKTDGYNGIDRIYFANEESRDRIVKSLVLQEISKKEAEIVNYKKSQLNKIAEIRQKYWDIINPSLCKTKLS